MRDLLPGVGGPIRKGFRNGTDRLVAPELTLERVRAWLPVLGITRVANVTGLDTVGIPVVMVCRPNSRSLSVSQGKGVTLAAAKASGIMESVEFWHAERIQKPLKLAGQRELQFSHALIDVAALPRLSISAYHDDLRILWIEGWDLLGARPSWLPYECVHMDYRLPFPPGSGSFAMSSNGLASGNHVLEALHHALCEVVERDATALWFAGGADARRRTRLDLETVDEPVCLDVLARFRDAGLLVAVWNTTSDLGIPCFVCEIVDAVATSARPLGASAGMGCHPVPRIAVLRALTEAAQGRLTRISSSRDDVRRTDFELNRNPDVLSAIRAEFSDAEPHVDFHAIEGFDGDSFDADLHWMLDRLRGVGIEEVVAVDLTREELGIPVVRVVVPGLEAPHESPGYVPGRRAVRAAQALAS